MKLIRFGAGACVAVFILVSALVGLAAAAPSGAPIRVGSTLSLTGPLSSNGIVHRVVGEIFVEQLNRKNGLLGRPVEWVLLDDQSKVDQTRTLYERLITVDKVDLLMPPYGTAGTLAAIAVAERYGKVLIGHTFGQPRLARYPLYFPGNGPGYEPEKTWPTRLFDALATTAKPPRAIVIVTSKFPSVHFISVGARDVAASRGLQVVLYLEYDFGTRDFGPIAARVKAAQPDFLWVGGIGLDSNLVLDALQKIGYLPPGHFHLFPAPGPLATHPAGAGALSVTEFEEHPPFTADPVAAEFVKLYHEGAAKAGLPYVKVDNQAAVSYAAWQILEASVTGPRALEEQGRAQWLKVNRVKTIAGERRFDGPSNYGEDVYKIRQVQRGDWKVVWPREVAAPGAQLIYPAQ